MINKIKAQLKKFWKWITFLIIGGVVLAAGIALQPEEIPFVIVNGERIEFPYTDDNAGENLIIRTDKMIYGGWDGAEVFMMIENISGENQETKIKFLFADKSKSLVGISRLEKDITYQVIVDNYGTITYDCSYVATSTEEIVSQTCEKQIIVSTSTETRYRDEWQRLVEVENEAEFSLPKDKIAYFQTYIQFPRQTKDEFIIEITGDKQGWGRLK